MINNTKRAQVYFNLHKRLFSVQQSGRVVSHTDAVVLFNVRFNIAKAGQRKVRETGKKNVHARVTGYGRVGDHAEWLSGIRQEFNQYGCRNRLGFSGYRRASYNPYQNDTFIDALTGDAIHDANSVIMFTQVGRGPIILYKKLKG